MSPILKYQESPGGKTASPKTILKSGRIVEYRVRDIPEPAVSPQYHVLYEDDNLLAVGKPGNLPCHPAGSFFNHTLWALLKHDFPELTPRFVSRLDRETSGIVLFAKSAEMHQKYQTYPAKAHPPCSHRHLESVPSRCFCLAFL